MSVRPLDGGYSPPLQDNTTDPPTETKTNPPAKEEKTEPQYPPDKVVERTDANGQKYTVIEHTVRPGECVWTIVHENATPMSMQDFYKLNKFNAGKQDGQLEQPNPGDDPDFIVPGQKIDLVVDAPAANTLNYLGKAQGADASLAGLNGQPFAHKPMADGKSQWDDAEQYANDMWGKTQEAAEYELRIAYQLGGQAAFDKRLAGMREYAPEDQHFQDVLTAAGDKVAKENPAQRDPAVTEYEESENVKNFTTDLQARWDKLTPEQKADPNAFTNIYNQVVAENDKDRDGKVDDPNRDRGLRVAGLQFELLQKAHTPEEKQKLLDHYLGTDARAWQLAAKDGTVSRAISSTIPADQGKAEQRLQQLKGLLTPDQMVQVMKDGPHPGQPGEYDQYLALPPDPEAYLQTAAGKSSGIHRDESGQIVDGATGMRWDAKTKRWVHDLTEKEQAPQLAGSKPIVTSYDPVTGKVSFKDGGEKFAYTGGLQGYEAWMMTHGMNAPPEPPKQEVPMPTPGPTPTPPPAPPN